ncbi:MAG: nitroreductase family protein [Meiothermus sp.]|nr:nitroreductase family protein [Meiothermus sp.]
MNNPTEKILSVKEAAQTRRSIRRYRSEPVSRQLLEEVLSIAQTAPSAWNLQPWRYVIVQDPALKTELQAAAFGQPQVASAPAVIVMYSDMKATLDNLEAVAHPGMPAERLEGYFGSIRGAFANNSEAQTEQWGAGQSYIALGYLLLTARAYGLDTSPMLGFNPNKVKELLGLPAHAAVPALLAIGYADESGAPHHRYDVNKIITWK